MAANRLGLMSKQIKSRGYARMVPAFRFGMSLAFGLLLCSLFVSGKPISSTRPVQTAPIQYFETNCSRCHGSYGRFFGDEFGKDLSDKQLRETITDMAAGPAKAPLQGEALDAQVAFHRALIRKEPFLVWTGASKTALWGEVTPGSKVQVKFGKMTVGASVKENRWRVDIPKGASAQAVITARLSGKQTVLDLSKSAYSHSRE
jgi:hypothetical protein